MSFKYDKEKQLIVGVPLLIILLILIIYNPNFFALIILSGLIIAIIGGWLYHKFIYT